MKKLIMMVVACLSAIAAFAQANVPEAVEVSGDYIYLVPTDMSLDEGKEKALVAAQKEAIGRTFGWLVIADDKLMVVEADDEESSYFKSYESAEVRGDWLKTIGKPKYEVKMDSITGGMMVHAFVKGMARKREVANIQLDTKLLRNVTDKSESTSFVSEENFFLRFRSPMQGYLMVYLLDEKGDAFCLLPYGRQEDGIMPVKANQDYTFFSEATASDEYKPYVDEYFFYTDKKLEYNRLCILFSPKLFGKAKDKAGKSEEYKHLNLPRQVDAEEFHEWLVKQKQLDSYLQVIEKEIELRKE